MRPEERKKTCQGPYDLFLKCWFRFCQQWEVVWRCLWHIKCMRMWLFFTLRLFFSSFFLIQFNACCCGSIHNGNRLPLVVRIPFCTDNSSGGKPSEPHLFHSTQLNHQPANTKDTPAYFTWFDKFTLCAVSFKFHNLQWAPSLSHLLISTSSVRRFSSLKGWLIGMPLSCTSFTHISQIISALKSELKAPA